ncbi:MAG: hypothetical protein MJZ76_04365 [Bacteroidales bacterium]|nr:hypothetical protein [Bacteroidales bacterium]
MKHIFHILIILFFAFAMWDSVSYNSVTILSQDTTSESPSAQNKILDIEALTPSICHIENSAPISPRTLTKRQITRISTIKEILKKNHTCKQIASQKRRIETHYALRACDGYFTYRRGVLII